MRNVKGKIKHSLHFYIMKKYYALKANVDDLGYYPQTKGIFGPYNFNDPDSVYYAIHRDPVGRLWVPEGFNMRPSAKWTDIIMTAEISYPALVVSAAFLDIITSAQHPPGLEYFPIKLVKKGEERVYYIIIINPGIAYAINFALSDFILISTTSAETTPIEINNLAEYIQIKNSDKSPYLNIRNLKFDFSNIAYDIFRLPRGSNFIRYIVSETLKERVEQAGLKGIRFTEIDVTQVQNGGV